MFKFSKNVIKGTLTSALVLCSIFTFGCTPASSGNSSNENSTDNAFNDELNNDDNSSYQYYDPKHINFTIMPREEYYKRLDDAINTTDSAFNDKPTFIYDMRIPRDYSDYRPKMKVYLNRFNEKKDKFETCVEIQSGIHIMSTFWFDHDCWFYGSDENKKITICECDYIPEKDITPSSYFEYAPYVGEDWDGNEIIQNYYLKIKTNLSHSWNTHIYEILTGFFLTKEGDYFTNQIDEYEYAPPYTHGPLPDDYSTSIEIGCKLEQIINTNPEYDFEYFMVDCKI